MNLVCFLVIIINLYLFKICKLATKENVLRKLNLSGLR
jgi:hypothetical protein